MPRTVNVSVEKWFLRRGLAALLSDTRHQTSTANRALPALLVLFLVSLLSLSYVNSSHANVNLFIAAGVVLVTWVGANLARKSPPFSAVERIGWAECAVFVLVPTLVAALHIYQPVEIDEFILSADTVRWVTTALVFVGHSITLVVVLVLVRYGVIALVVWLARQIMSSIAVAGAALFRTLPLLMGVVLFVFLSNEVWQSLGRLDSWAFVLALLLFVVLSGAFLSRREQLDIASLTSFCDREEVGQLLRGTPYEGRADTIELPTSAKLNPVQEANLRLVAACARLSIAAMVSLAVFAFFVIFGFMVINAALVKSWVNAEPNVLWTIVTSVHRYDLTYEHVRVATFLAVFSGFYFAVASATDPAMRAGMTDTSADIVRQAAAVRLAVLACDEADDACAHGVRGDADEADDVSAAPVDDTGGAGRQQD